MALLGFSKVVLMPGAAFLVGCSGTLCHEKTTPDARVECLLEQEVSNKETPGISYSVVRLDGTIFTRQLGKKDIKTGEPVTRDTYFAACSITKMLTALAVMRLVDRGQLELDTSLSDYFPAHPYGDTVTLRQLLAHTGGVPNPMPLNWFKLENEELNRDQELVRILRDSNNLKNQPGQTYRYSNIGYWLLEKAIEGSTGEDYAAAISHELTTPLELGGSITFALPGPLLATGHQRKWTGSNGTFYLLAPSRYWGKSFHGWSRFERLRWIGRGYGGAFVRIEALERVLIELLNPDSPFLSPSAKEDMFRVQRTNDGETIPQTLGWVSGAVGEHTYFGKQGGALGFHGNVRIYPKAGIGTVYLANSTIVSPGPIDQLSDRLDIHFLNDSER